MRYITFRIDQENQSRDHDWGAVIECQHEGFNAKSIELRSRRVCHGFHDYGARAVRIEIMRMAGEDDQLAEKWAAFEQKMGWRR
jgi:hypothetical protein